MADYAAAAAPPSAAVDWQLVDQELSRVPGEFKDPKFYALKHVVDILTAEDPRALVSQLRDQEEVLADLVDGMVQGYHSGFAKSIQNYSQILQLFGEAKDQVVGLKKALADASRQLSAQSRTLQQQWRKSLALESSLQLLDSIQLVAAAPEAIDMALAAKEWSSAVSLLMEACSKLVGDGISKVGALRRLKADMVTVSLMLEAQLLQELHSRVYLPTAANSPPPAAAAAAAATAAGGSSGGYGGSSGSSGGQRTDSPSRLGAQQQQQQQQQLLIPVKRALARDAAGAKDNLSRLSAAGSSSSSMPAFVLDALASDSTAAAGGGSSSSAASLLRGSAAGSGGSAAAAAAGTVGELVTCLMQLDGLDDAKLYLLLHARAGVRQMILRVVEAWAQQQEAAVQAGGISSSSNSSSRTGGRLGAYAAGSSSSSPVRGMGGLLAPTQGTAAKDAWTVPSAVQLSAQQLLSAVFDACLKALANMGVLLQEMIDTSTATSSSSSSRSKGGGSSSSRMPGSPLKHSTAGGSGGQQHSAAALQTLKQQQAAQQQHHHRSGSSGGGSGTTAAAAAAIAAAPGVLAAAPTASAAAAGAALDPLVALQSMQSGLLPASSVSFAAGIAASLGATVASGSSSMLYGPNGLATGTIQGLEWAKATGRTPIGLLKTQCAHLWQEMQAEVLLLLGELLRAALRGGGAGAPQGAARCTAALEDPEAFKPQSVGHAGLAGIAGGHGLDACHPPQRSSNTHGPSLALVMATEPDATLLAQDDPAAFYVPLAPGGGAAVSAATSAAEAGGVLRLWGQGAAFEDYEGFLKSLKSADKPVLVPGHHRPHVKVRGLGLEGESAAEEVLLLCHREAAAGSQLLSLTGSRAGGLVTLASLAESADWVADYLAHMAANSGPGGSLAPGSWLGRHSSSKTAAAAGSTGGRQGGSKGGVGQQSNLGRGSPGGGLPRSAGAAAAAAAGGGGEPAAVSRALLMLSHRFRSLAGVCCRVLRLDLLLLAGHQLQALGSVSHLCEEEDVLEVHPCIGSLSRVASRAAEEVFPHLSPRKLSYVCGAVAVAAARSMIWVLQDIPDMNALGVERMIRGLALLQGPLGSLGAAPGAAGGPSADVVRAYDRAKSFYTLVGLPSSEVVLLAADRPGRYSRAEWESLLQVCVPGRPCDQTDMAALHRALDKHYHLSTGQKVAEFFEDVRHTVQVPVQSFTGNVSAGFKGGFTQAKALLNKAAGAVSDAAAATATSVSTAAAKARTGRGSAAAGSTGGSTGTLQ